MKGRELFINLSSLAISGAGLVVGIRNDLWGLVGNDPVNVGFGALGLAVLLLLGGASCSRISLEWHGTGNKRRGEQTGTLFPISHLDNTFQNIR